MSNPIDNYNKIVTTVNSVTSDYTFDVDANNLIVIDTSNNRIGINTVYPQRSIHISGGDVSSGIITPYLQMISGGEGVGSDFIPSQDNTYTLGSESKQWKDLYVGPGSIYMNKLRIFSLDSNNNLNLNISGDGLNLDSNLDISGYIHNTNDILNNVNISGNFVPTSDNKYSLGDNTKGWSDLYIKDGGIYLKNQKIIYFDENNILTISSNQIQTKNSLTVNGTFFSSQSINTNNDIGGGNIYGTMIGKTANGALNICGGFFSTLYADETSTFKQDLIVENDISVNQKLKLGSDASFNANVDISNHLTVFGDVSLNDNVDISNHLTVFGDVSLNNNVDISNHLTVFGDVSLNDNVDISNHLTVLNGDVSFNNNIKIGNHLTVFGDVSLNDNVDISNHLTVLGGVSLNSKVDISGNLNVDGSIFLKNNLLLGSHIIPNINATYDIGSAEYKIRHLFLSSNSLWIGDENKINISNGNFEFKQRLKEEVPNIIKNLNDYSLNELLVLSDVSNISDIKIQDYINYASIKGENYNVDNIFNTDISNNWKKNLNSENILNKKDFIQNDYKIYINFSSVIDLMEINNEYYIKYDDINNKIIDFYYNKHNSNLSNYVVNNERLRFIPYGTTYLDEYHNGAGDEPVSYYQLFPINKIYYSNGEPSYNVTNYNQNGVSYEAITNQTIYKTHSSNETSTYARGNGQTTDVTQTLAWLTWEYVAWNGYDQHEFIINFKVDNTLDKDIQYYLIDYTNINYLSYEYYFRKYITKVNPTVYYDFRLANFNTSGVGTHQLYGQGYDASLIITSSTAQPYIDGSGIYLPNGTHIELNTNDWPLMAEHENGLPINSVHNRTLSIEFYFKAGTVPSGQLNQILSIDLSQNNDRNNYLLYLTHSESNKLEFSYTASYSGSDLVFVGSPKITIDVNNFEHIVMTMSANGEMYIYKNGVYDNSFNLGHPLTNYYPSKVTLGIKSNVATSYIDGPQIAFIKYYDGVLYENEVEHIYNENVVKNNPINNDYFEDHINFHFDYFLYRNIGDTGLKIHNSITLDPSMVNNFLINCSFYAGGQGTSGDAAYAYNSIRVLNIEEYYRNRHALLRSNSYSVTRTFHGEQEFRAYGLRDMYGLHLGNPDPNNSFSNKYPIKGEIYSYILFFAGIFSTTHGGMSPLTRLSTPPDLVQTKLKYLYGNYLKTSLPFYYNNDIIYHDISLSFNYETKHLKFIDCDFDLSSKKLLLLTPKIPDNISPEFFVSPQNSGNGWFDIFTTPGDLTFEIKEEFQNNPYIYNTSDGISDYNSKYKISLINENNEIDFHDNITYDIINHELCSKNLKIGNATTGYYIFVPEKTNNRLDLFYSNNNSNDYSNRNLILTLDKTGNLRNKGFMQASQGFTSSDDRLKHNEIDISNSLNIIRNLKPQKYQKTFTKKTHDFVGDISNEQYIIESGFIAQDLLNTDLSFCISGSEEDIYSLNYNNIFTYNVAATKELDTIVQTQQNKINNLEAENTLIKNALNELLHDAGKPNV